MCVLRERKQQTTTTPPVSFDAHKVPRSSVSAPLKNATVTITHSSARMSPGFVAPLGLVFTFVFPGYSSAYLLSPSSLMPQFITRFRVFHVYLAYLWHPWEKWIL